VMVPRRRLLLPPAPQRFNLLVHLSAT